MPRVALTEEQRLEYKKRDFCAYINGQMRVRGIRQHEVAKELGITQQALSYRIRKGVLEYRDMLVIFKRMNLTDEEIIRQMRL